MPFGADNAVDKLELMPQQIAFMDTFGYLVFPGLVFN